jgi:hypothetical protein
MERTLWHLGLRDDRIFVGAFTPWICYAPADVLLGHGSSSIFYFLFIVLGCWVVGHEKREIPFLSEWSFCFQGSSFDLSSIQSGVSHLFRRTAHWGAKISFLEQTWCDSLLWFLFSFLFPSAFFTTVAYGKRREKQERIRVVGKKGRDGNSTLRFNVNEHLSYL